MDEIRDFLHANPSRQATAVTPARFRVQGSYAKGHLNPVPRGGAFKHVGATEAFVPPISYFYPPEPSDSGQCLRLAVIDSMTPVDIESAAKSIIVRSPSL